MDWREDVSMRGLGDGYWAAREWVKREEILNE